MLNTYCINQSVYLAKLGILLQTAQFNLIISNFLSIRSDRKFECYEKTWFLTIM